MKKNLSHYTGLNYPIELITIPSEDGGGYQASIPYLGSLAFRGDGETIQEAINSLSEIKEYLFSQYIEKGIPIPEPSTNEDKSYSGRFVLRIPAELHQSLSIEAQKNNTTLNQYCIYLLTRKSCFNTIQDEVSDLCKELRKKREETDYSFESEEPSNIISFDDKKYASGV